MLKVGEWVAIDEREHGYLKAVADPRAEAGF